jgi:hypothetical protein
LTRGETTLVLVVVLVLLLAVGGGVIVMAARGRKEVHDQVAAEVERQLAELRPDLSDDARGQAGNILGAQAVLETGGGRTIAWRQGWNFGNVTAGASWTGDVVQGGDTEPDASGAYVPITQRFRKYASLADAVTDFLTVVLNWRRERDAGAAELLYAGDADGYVAALRQAGYFTAPLTEYQAGVRGALA